MRTSIIHLLFAVLAVGAVRGRSQLALEAATDRTLYRSDIENKVYVEARIRPAVTAVSEASPTPVRNLAFVLDRSGTMAGAPIQALRQGMAAVLNSLSDRDVVSVVLFGSEVETVLEAKRRDQIDGPDRLLAQMEPAGGAALYDALNQGAAQLRRYAGPATINHLVLVTDGRPTKGPREFDDFSRLVGVFAREGTTLSTIGLGQDFDEDLLAAMARIGNGHFRYVDRPEKLVDAMQAEIAPLRSLLARDAVLTIEFGAAGRNVTSYGWEPAVVDQQTVTFRFPYLFGTQDLNVLASTVLPFRRFPYELAKVRLQWKEAASDATHELTQTLSVAFEADLRSVRSSVDPVVTRACVNTLISEGMQRAIEQLDKGNFGRALRALRTARSDARTLNFDLEDAQIDAKIQQLDTYIAEVQARGLNRLDRKVLRSGLFNEFATPTADDHPDN